MIRTVLRYALRHPWQTWLSFLGIMLGVMMVVAVDLASSSARKAFDLSVQSISGSVSHQIVGGSNGVPDAVFTRLRTELAVRRSAPGLSGQVSVDGRAFTLIGLDAVSEAGLQRQRPGLRIEGNIPGQAFLSAFIRPDAVLMSVRSAQELGLQADTLFTLFSGTQHEVYLAAILDSDNPAATQGLIFADIAAAQQLLGKTGYLDSIDLIIDDEQARRIRQWLPPQLTLVTAAEREASLRQLSEAFHINLLAMSLLSLLVAALLIYNTMTLSVLQRQRTLGIFRCQGVSGREIMTLILGEAGALGLFASSGGVLLGLGLGQFLVRLVTRTVDDLYFNLNVTDFMVDPFSLIKGLGLGLGVSLLAALLPAWHATRVGPLSLQHRALRDRLWQSRVSWMAAVGVALVGVGFMLLQPERGSLLTGFMALTFTVFGFCFLVPALVTFLLYLLLGLAGFAFSSQVKMALRDIRQGISRTGLAVATLAVAVSVTMGVGIMVQSFRNTVDAWLQQSLTGDIQITSLRPGQQSVSPALVEQVRQVPGVSGVTPVTMKQVESEAGPLRLTAVDISVADGFYLKEGAPAALEAFMRGEGIFISEPLAFREGLESGDQIIVYTDRGPHPFHILGVIYDYTSGIGMVAMHSAAYGRWWDDDVISRLTVMTDGSPLVDTEVLAAIRAVLREQEIAYQATPNADIRQVTLAIFDRTFAITNVLRLLAIVVAFVGILSSLMALQLERFREFSILRATGMTPGQLAGQIMVRTVVMGVFAGLLAIPLGLIMSDILIDVINRRSFGWSMQHTVPAGVLGEGMFLALLAALIAGLYPAWKASRILPAAGLREE